MRKQMLRVLIREGWMKCSAHQSWTVRRLLLSALVLPNLFSSQQKPSWHLRQTTLLFAQNPSMAPQLPESAYRGWPGPGTVRTHAAPPCLPSSPSNLALAPLAPDTHLPSLPRMLPGGSCVLFLHLCSICARCPLFSGSFAYYLPHPFCSFSSLTLHAGLHVSALFLLHHWIPADIFHILFSQFILGFFPAKI